MTPIHVFQFLKELNITDYVHKLYTTFNKLFNMFCEHCGKEIPYDAKFCNHCGKQLKTTPPVENKKNMHLAILLSLFLISLGICYAGNKKKGIILFVIILIFTRLRHASGIFFAISMIIWVYALYETYREVKIANGEPNPKLIEDIQNPSNFEKIASIVAIVLLLLVYSFIIMTIFY